MFLKTTSHFSRRIVEQHVLELHVDLNPIYYLEYNNNNKKKKQNKQIISKSFGIMTYRQVYKEHHYLHRLLLLEPNLED